MRFIVCLLLLLESAQAQELPINLEIVKPRREPTHKGILEDIDCRLEKSYSSKYSYNLVTWGHEASHTLNNEIVKGRADVWAFYCLNGQAVIFTDPKIRMADVRNEIPQEKRCDQYKLYLNLPLNEMYPMLLFDEHSAFINGCLVAKEYKDEPQLKYEMVNARKMGYFCDRMLVVLERVRYKEVEQLKAFHEYQKSRIVNLEK